MKSSLLAAGIAATLPLLAGCSSFGKHWRAAMETPPPSDSIAGAWEGRWVSERNGHKGRLRCVMEPTEENQYQARYHAKFWKIFSSSYTVPFHVQREGTNFVFTGESDLGKLAGGVYHYSGSATPEQFRSSYKSKYDRGRFAMRRPGSP